MNRHRAAMVLEEIALWLDLAGGRARRADALRETADLLVAGDVDVSAVTGAGGRGEGDPPPAASWAVVRDLLEGGLPRPLENVRSETSAGLTELLRVPGLEPRRARLLRRRFGIGSLDDLDGALGLEGPGEADPARRRSRVVEAFAHVRALTGWRLSAEARSVAARIAGVLEARRDVVRVEPAGELRRLHGIVPRIDLVALVTGRAAPVSRALQSLPGVVKKRGAGPDAAVVRLSRGVDVRLRCARRPGFASAWMSATGDAAHLAALGERARQRGLGPDFPPAEGRKSAGAGRSERELYDRLELPFIPPELREGVDELELAARGRLSRLVRTGDLRGAFHCHTTYSDGRGTLREMAAGARARGWRYLGVSDHSAAAVTSSGMGLEALAAQHREIGAWNDAHGDELWLFKGVEADILADGRLDYSDLGDGVLDRFDFVIGSIHARRGLSRPQQTRRVIRAMRDPRLTFLGHPTGRTLLSSEGYPLDVPSVIDAAADHDVAIEINADPRRLDLDWRWWRRARARGVLTAVNPDAHGPERLDDVRWGVRVARKGGLTAGSVINTWSREDVARYFLGRRRPPARAQPASTASRTGSRPASASADDTSTGRSGETPSSSTSG